MSSVDLQPAGLRLHKRIRLPLPPQRTAGRKTALGIPKTSQPSWECEGSVCKYLFSRLISEAFSKTLVEGRKQTVPCGISQRASLIALIMHN